MARAFTTCFPLSSWAETGDTSAAPHCRPEQTYTPVFCGGRILLQADPPGSKTDRQVRAPPTIAGCDKSGSMTYTGGRGYQAQHCLVTAEAVHGIEPDVVCDASPCTHTFTYAFGTATARTSARGFGIDHDQGTKLVALAEGLKLGYADLHSAQQRGVDYDYARDGSNARPNVLIVTDAEAVSDSLAAKQLLESLPMDGALVFVGIGDSHTLYSLTKTMPDRCAQQVFYVKVPEIATHVQGGVAAKYYNAHASVPCSAIQDALFSVPIRFTQGKEPDAPVHVRVLQHADFLLPRDVCPHDVRVYGRKLDAGLRIEDGAPVGIQFLKRVCRAATLSVVRAYNHALAVLELGDRSKLQAVADLAAAELEFITELRARVSAANVSPAEITETQASIERAIHSLSIGAAPGGSGDCRKLRAIVRRARDFQNTGTGTDAAAEIVNVFREVCNLVRAPPSAASTQLATGLLESLSGGKMSSAKTDRLLGRIAHAQCADLYACTADKLQAYEELMEAGGQGAPPMRSTEFPEAEALDAQVTAEDRELCIVTGSPYGCLVAVGTLKRHISGAVNPLVTRVVGGISREAYSVQGFRLACAARSEFRATAGMANGIVGVHPGDSHGAALALKLLASHMATGDWNTELHGLKPVLLLLAGVAHLLKPSLNTSSSRSFAGVLARGFLGVAARVKCRVLAADGSPDMTTPVVSGLAASYALLRNAYAEPRKYVGPQIMSAEYWLALEFAMQCAESCLGAAYALAPMSLEFKRELVAAGIARLAYFFVQPSVSSDATLAYEAEARNITHFINTLPLRVGKKISGVDDVHTDSTNIKNIALSYEYRDVSVPNAYEVPSINEALAFATEIISDEDQATYSRIVRAIFWEAVTCKGKVTQRLLDTFCDQANGWERRTLLDAQALRDERKLQHTLQLRARCVAAFSAAATTLPVSVFADANVREVKVHPADAGAKVNISNGNCEGAWAGRPTGLFKERCLALDSTFFLRDSVQKYVTASFTAGAIAEKTFLPCFHATLTAWQSHMPRDNVAHLLDLATKRWTSACPKNLADSVTQWVWQRKAYKHVMKSELPIDTAAIMRKLAPKMPGPADVFHPDAPAADWAGEADALEFTACTSAYGGGDTPQWSYYRAIVEFYAALRTDTDAATGVFNADTILKNLRKHRCFVVSKRSYLHALALAEVTAEDDLLNPVCEQVYAEQATLRIHS